MKKWNNQKSKTLSTVISIAHAIAFFAFELYIVTILNKYYFYVKLDVIKYTSIAMLETALISLFDYLTFLNVKEKTFKNINKLVIRRSR